MQLALRIWEVLEDMGEANVGGGLFKEDAILYFKKKQKDYTIANYSDCRGVILKMMKKLRLTQRVQRVESTIILANKFCMRNVTFNC